MRENTHMTKGKGAGAVFRTLGVLVLGTAAIWGYQQATKPSKPAKDEPTWFCRDAAQAEQHAKGWRECWRSKIECEGMCWEADEAWCFDLTAGSVCMATEDMCAQLQRTTSLAGSYCERR